MKQVLSISDSFENTSYDFRSKTRTFRKYGVEPFICVPQYTSSDGSTLRNDISESLQFCFETAVVDAIAVGLMRAPEDVYLLAYVLSQVEHNMVLAEPGLIDDSGNIMVTSETYETFRQYLLPQIQFISINLLETEVLSGMEVKNRNDCLLAVKSIFETYNCVVYVRGGQATGGEDLLFGGTMVKWFKPLELSFSYSPDRSFLAAVACELVSGKRIVEAIASARTFYAGSEEERKEQAAKAAAEKAAAEKAAAEKAAVKKAAEEKVVETPAETVVEAPVEEVATPVASATEVAQPEQQENIPKVASMTKTTSLISPAKNLRDIAHSIGYEDKAAEAPKSTVSDIKQKHELPTLETPDIAGQARKAYSGKSDSESELDALRARLKKLAEM
ncbi:MAG: bifunctional hydroxymethylpyrimidine kinase/phosphomethylpyrimidine kinase [Saccharofermentans sp.]|nr:bifunctional hydroxymethylpyrimidine kinase/phosphomethylpyrimidine kinase [Saccharofermentans sp.]